MIRNLLNYYCIINLVLLIFLNSEIFTVLHSSFMGMIYSWLSLGYFTALTMILFRDVPRYVLPCFQVRDKISYPFEVKCEQETSFANEMGPEWYL